MPVPSLQRQQILTLATGLVLSLAAWLAVVPFDPRGWMLGAPLGRDFVNFWMAPRLMLAGQGATLVDLAAYTEAIKAAFDIAHDPRLLFVYPPHVLLFLLPFSGLPYLPAVLAWTALNLAALAWTVRLSGAPPRATLVLAVCLCPAAVAMMMYGHFGGLLALGSTVAVIESRRRPWLSGLCLAGLSVKPQFAAALGLILLCGGRWRCLLVAGPATAALVGLSAAVFGVAAWERFLTVTMPMQSAFITEFRAKMIETSVSAYFAARFSGVPALAAWTIQGAVSVVALVSATLALRRGPAEPAALTVILLGALAMQPYAAHYDLAVAAPALTLVVLSRDPGPAPLALAAWLLIPLARILIVFDLPILGVIVPGALVTQAARLLGPDVRRRLWPRSAALEPAA